MKRAFLLAAVAVLLCCCGVARAESAGNIYAKAYQLKQYSAAHPELSRAELRIAYVLKLDEPNYENVVTVENPSDITVFVSKHYALPTGYMPEGLTEVSREYAEPGVRLRQDCCGAFLNMVHAMEPEGLSLYIKSGYRTNQPNDDPDDMRKAWPGHSEHQTGLAFDLRPKGEVRPYLSDYKYQNTREFAWLTEHAHEYGFILSYPKGKTEVTGFKFEPWHWRYVGEAVSRDMKEKGFTAFPEYWATYLSVNAINTTGICFLLPSQDRPEAYED